MNRYRKFALALTAVLASAATAHALPGKVSVTPLPQHSSRAAKEKSVLIVLDNETVLHRRVQVGETVYDLLPTRMVRLRVPAGTIVTSRCSMRSHENGEEMLIASAETSGRRVVVD